MSTNQYLIEYQKLYSKYVEQLMIVHNYHDNFVKYIGLESSRKIRIALMEMIKLEKEMRFACREAYKENNRLLKESRKKPRAGCTLPGKRGSGRRKKIKTGNDNATNQ
jgi:hypothetical protein